MGDYHRQSDDGGGGESSKTSGPGGWRARLFHRSSPSEVPDERPHGNHRRSYSAGRSGAVPLHVEDDDFLGYKAPSAPTTPAGARPFSSHVDNTATPHHIELPTVRTRSCQGKMEKNIPLFNNSTLTDNDTIDTSSVLNAASEEIGQHQERRSRQNFRTMVDELVKDVIGNNREDDDGGSNAVTSSNNLDDDVLPLPQTSSTLSALDLETAGSDYMTTDGNSMNSILETSQKRSPRLGTSGRYHRSRSGRRKRLKKSNSIHQHEEKLDTYSGVFLPCLAQIVGVIFFLRLPTITGQAGTIGATLIILTCVFSTFITSLSLSAIASNGTIQAGGPYYIISRTLGVEIGGALGLLFYLGTAFGASMHVMGAVETLIHRRKHAYQMNSLGLMLTLLDSCPTQVWSLLLMFIIARIVSVGSKYVTNAANFFLITVGLSILSILLGTILFAFGIYDGSLTDEDRAFNDNLYPNYRPDPKTGVTPTFWGLVALFYPATTGILAGTNRSSKLATPNKSIPIGTIGAIAVTTVLYIFQVWLIGSVVSNEVLITNKLVLATVAFPSRIVAKLGMTTSCIGAALQCMAGAPQLLGAIAKDDAIPFLKFLTRKKRKKGEQRYASPRSKSTAVRILGLAGLGESTSVDNGDVGDGGSLASEKSADIEQENSKRAVWFTWAIASLGTLLGNIDHITPILTMFYLMMYGGINLCCFLLAWVDSPGFRPQFKYFSQNTALLGFIWCFVLSFLISWVMALMALCLLFSIFKYIDWSYQRQMSYNSKSKTGESLGANWGDAFVSVRYKITTAVLARLTGTENFHAKNWRPQLLTFVDTDDAGVPLSAEVLALAAQFRGGRGLNIVVSIKQGSYLRKGTFEISQHCSENLKKCMERERLQDGFCEVILTLSNFEEAVWSAVMHSGLGPVSPNTVLMSWMTDWRRRSSDPTSNESTNFPENNNIHACSANEFVNTIKGLGNMKKAVCILKGRKFPRCDDIMPRGSTIDIYWVVDDGGLCLLLSYIIIRNSTWRRNANLQLFAVTTLAEDNHPDLESAVVEFLQQIRINATVHIVSMITTELADDFRAQMCNVCPTGAPTLTIGEKFRLLKDDAMSASSSVSGKGQGLQSFLPLGDKACLPGVPVGRCDSDPMDNNMTTTEYNRKFFVEIPENDVVEPMSQQLLRLETAKKFNNLIRRNSPSASLVVTHLPIPQKVTKASEFMEYVDTMFKDVDNMLLIQGTGVEYLTTVA